MTQKDLVKGLVIPNITGDISCMAVTFDDDGYFECSWCILHLEGADMKVLSPKKKFGISGVYPWFKVNDKFKVSFMEQPTNIKEGEFLIPWSDLKPFVKN